MTGVRLDHPAIEVNRPARGERSEDFSRWQGAVDERAGVLPVRFGLISFLVEPDVELRLHADDRHVQACAPKAAQLAVEIAFWIYRRHWSSGGKVDCGLCLSKGPAAEFSSQLASVSFHESPPARSAPLPPPVLEGEPGRLPGAAPSGLADLPRDESDVAEVDVDVIVAFFPVTGPYGRTVTS